MSNNPSPNPLALPIMEHFFTIQGEGFHSGRAAYFIRTAGCDVGCVWCDVKESWTISEDQWMTIAKIIEHVQAVNADFVVITGGEPTMHSLITLVSSLQALQIEVAIETAGVHHLDAPIDWYCFSPKKFMKPIEEAYLKANELKVVINHLSDFAWAEEHAAKVNASCKLFLQPEWEKHEKLLPAIIDYVKGNQKWNISLQTHKYMNIP
ncbi:MAG: 7-carboxy-7-deazaguanine synthase QueE [Flavobacteriales bacterium]